MNKRIKIGDKQKRTPTELIEASKHLIWGMRYLSERLEFLLRYINAKNEGEIGGILSSINDSFLIHARKMVEFLYNTSVELYDDDVIAEDYFDSPEVWRSLRLSQNEVLQKTKQDIGKLLAHFTYRVIEYPDGSSDWNISTVYVEIFQALQVFLREVDPSLLDKDADYLRIDNPDIVICYPVFPPKGKAPYQIHCTRDQASGFQIVENR